MRRAGRFAMILAALGVSSFAQDDGSGPSTPQELADHMLASSVVIFGMITENGRSAQATQGAGFFLDSQTVVTSAAVCCTRTRGQMPQPRVVLGTESAFAKVQWSSTDDGLAILKLDHPLGGDDAPDGISVVPSKYARAGQPVFAVQFPGPGDAIEPRVDAGELQDLAPVEGFDAPVFHTSAPINAYNAGGALFDACGNAVGINWKAGGGTQYAFTVDALLEPLDGAGLSERIADGPCQASLGDQPTPWWRLPLGSQWIAIVVMVLLLAGVGLWLGKRSSVSPPRD